MRFDLRHLMVAVVAASAVACMIQREPALVVLLPIPAGAALAGRQMARVNWSVGYCGFLIAATLCAPVAACHSAWALAGVCASTVVGFRYFLRATVGARHAP